MMKNKIIKLTLHFLVFLNFGRVASQLGTTSNDKITDALYSVSIRVVPMIKSG